MTDRQLNQQHHPPPEQSQTPFGDPKVTPGDFPFHLLFPTPLPEPPRVVSTKPLVSDVSITSEAPAPPAKVKLKTSTKTAKPRTAPPTTTIYPSDQKLQKLRRKYGLISASASDQADDIGYTSDADSEDSIICLEDEPKKKGTRTLRTKPPSTSRAKQPPTEEHHLRARMAQIQCDLRQQFQKLQIHHKGSQQSTKIPEATAADLSSSSGVSSGSNGCNNCLKTPAEPLRLETSQRSAGTTTANSSNITEQEMLKYIRRQDAQLQQISRQIEELLRIHKTGESSANSSMEHSRTTSDSSEKDRPPRRSTETMTSFNLANATEYQRLPPASKSNKDINAKATSRKTTPKVPVISVPSGSDYLDSSIEQVRRDLEKSLQSSSSSSSDSSDSEVQQQVRQHEASDGLYTNMLSTINSILVRNGSFESANSETIFNRDHQHDDWSGNRSSCSEPEAFSLRNTRPKATSSPKQRRNNKRTTITQTVRQTVASSAAASSPRTPRSIRRRYLHSEQSLYIQKLASKYEIHEEEEIPPVRRPPLPPEPPSPTDDLLKRYSAQRDYDAKVYCLSEHNTSIATRDYLDRYGLTYSPPTERSSKTVQKQKPLPPTIPPRSKYTGNTRLHEPLLEVDETLYEDALAHQTIPKQVHENINNNNKPGGKVREVKSRTTSDHTVPSKRPPPPPTYSRILDLEVIKSLPKLT